MADYDSDSSGGDDVATNVLLGYASKEATVDEFSQLGGHPTWLDGARAPSGSLARCKVCHGLLNLLLQLHADLPDRFVGHERRLYLWACRRKACRRKAGSVRAFRATKVDQAHATAAATVVSVDKPAATETPSGKESAKPVVNLGETLFGAKSPSAAPPNPFATSTSGNSNATSNPFASASSLAAEPAQKPTETEPLAETFAQKARISSPPPLPSSKAPMGPPEPWPESSAFPEPYPASHVDAEQEYLEAVAPEVPSNTRLDTSGEDGGSTADNKAAFESSMDKAFQRFADRLSQNPEQVLRYEFDGQPLLYSHKDAVGKLLAPASDTAKVRVASSSTSRSRIPRCEACGAPRVFELQLTPHAITELEAEEMSIDGMDWGTILLGVCSADCGGRAETGYVEEWVGVQWEELTERRR